MAGCLPTLVSLLIAPLMTERGLAAPAADLAGRWPMETVVMESGRRYSGLIENGEDGWLRMIEVNRDPGRPMHLVILPIQKSDVRRVQRLDESQREKLRRRIERFRHRASIQAAREAAVELNEGKLHDLPMRIYHGAWFQLASTAEPAIVRRAVIRTDQLFTAFRQLLPPRYAPDREQNATGPEATHPLPHPSEAAPVDRFRRPRLVLFASDEEYRRALREYGLSLDNPACFLQRENLVLLSSDLRKEGGKLRDIQARHERLADELRALEEGLSPRMAARAKQLGEQGYSRSVISSMLRRERILAERAIEAKRAEVELYDRLNRQAMQRVTRQVFRRLFHEGWHSYAESYVYPSEKWELPPWFAEGMALMFESALLESDTLRIDAPNRAALKTLQADLRSRHPLTLAELLAADREAFLIDDDAQAPTDRLYAAAWGLVYYLAFERDLLTRAKLDRYLAGLAAADRTTRSQVQRFEQVVGQPLAEFESQWRAAMLRLR